MSRDDGFSIADVSSSMLDDPKFRALWRDLNDAAAMGQAVTVYVATVLESWRSGSPAKAIDAAPMWLPDASAAIAALIAADLLDDAGRIPDHVWQSWYGPAASRRKVTRDRWQRANDKRRSRGDSAVTSQPPRGDIGDTVRPSVPTDRPLRAIARPTGQEPRKSTTERREAPEKLRDVIARTARAVPLADQVEVDTARLEERYAQDPEHWFEGAKS